MDKATIISKLGRVPVLSGALRRYARRYRDGSVVTIKAGVAAGMKWRRYHRYRTGHWTGHFELPVQRAIERELNAGDCFYDVGCNAGFFSLVAARLVGEQGRVVSFDPDPDNCAAAREQIELNGLADRWAIEQTAVADRAGEATFERDRPGSPAARLVETGDARFGADRAGTMELLQVALTTLDDALARHPRPRVVKMDIEGAEVLAMRGAGRLLAEVRPVWFIELHGPESEQAVRAALVDNHYAFFTINGESIESGASLPRHVIARPG